MKRRKKRTTHKTRPIRRTAKRRICTEMSGTDFGRILAAAGVPAARCFKLIYLSGLRPSEFVGLRWRDVKTNRHGTFIVVKEPKSFFARRSIYCSKAFVETLGKPGKPDEPVAGEGMTIFMLLALFRRALKRAGLAFKGYALHSMRHACISRVVRGISLRTLARKLGCTSIKKTERYFKPTDRDERWKT